MSGPRRTPYVKYRYLDPQCLKEPTDGKCNDITVTCYFTKNWIVCPNPYNSNEQWEKQITDGRLLGSYKKCISKSSFDDKKSWLS